MKEHMTELQRKFFDHWKGKTPWQDHPEVINEGMKRSDRYIAMKAAGATEKEIDKAFYETTKIYASHHNINYDSWSFPNWGIAMYETNCGLNDELGMNYHTDFIQHEKDKPGSKFGITAVIYGNDDYEGGELCFKIFKDKNYNQVDELIYKPQEGDIVVFPSNEPYYHGTKIVTSGQKFIFRLYWKYYYSGSIIWKKMIEKYKKDKKGI